MSIHLTTAITEVPVYLVRQELVQGVNVPKISMGKGVKTEMVSDQPF